MNRKINDYIRSYAKGKSFEFTEWSKLNNYTNSGIKQDFVTYKGSLYACICDVAAGNESPDKDTKHWKLAIDNISMKRENLITSLGFEPVNSNIANIFNKEQIFSKGINLNNTCIKEVKNPENDSDAATKNYVDTYITTINNKVNSLKNAGYLYAGIATTETNPGTPDVKVFYIANGKGTYTNFGNINVVEDDVVILYWDTSWHKVSTGIASNEYVAETKATKRVGNNLFTGENITNGYINWAGGVSGTTGNFRITDYIKADSNLISNYNQEAGTNNAVYDKNKNFLRVFDTAKYIYQEGDAYVRYSFSSGWKNYMIEKGDTVTDYEPYTEDAPLLDYVLQNKKLIQDSNKELINIPIDKVYIQVNATGEPLNVILELTYQKPLPLMR